MRDRPKIPYRTYDWYGRRYAMYTTGEAHTEALPGAAEEIRELMAMVAPGAPVQPGADRPPEPAQQPA